MASSLKSCSVWFLRTVWKASDRLGSLSELSQWNCAGITTQIHILEMRLLRHHQDVPGFFLKFSKISFHICILTTTHSNSVDRLTVAEISIYLIAWSRSTMIDTSSRLEVGTSNRIIVCCISSMDSNCWPQVWEITLYHWKKWSIFRHR